MNNMTGEQLIAATRVAAKFESTATAQLLNELATRLDCALAALRQKAKRCDALAGESVSLKAAFNPATIPVEAVEVLGEVAKFDHDSNECGSWTWVDNEDEVIRAVLEVLREQNETPATVAWQRELRQKAWAEGINYAASRLAAAFNHGFIDKPLAEVFDIVRMIITAKEDISNDPVPAADGLSGEYAEKALENWEQKLRNGEAV